jgi:hypothetical protein
VWLSTPTSVALIFINLGDILPFLEGKEAAWTSAGNATESVVVEGWSYVCPRSWIFTATFVIVLNEVLLEKNVERPIEGYPQLLLESRELAEIDGPP